MKAWSFYLDRWLLLYGDNGVVTGAGYADVRVGLPALWLLVGLAVVAAGGAFVNVWVRSTPLAIAAALIAFGGAFLRRRGARPLPALCRQAERAELEKIVYRAQHRSHAAGLQSRRFTVKPFPADAGR